MQPDASAPPIDANTALCGVILHPASHTRSPAMHNAAFRALDLNAVYLAFDVTPGNLEAALQGARAFSIRQLAVSIPHKEAILPFLDAVDATARAIGAVNTVTTVDGALVGSNTDWVGAVRALERETQLAAREAVVLGAGGAARAVVYGLLARGARVRVLNRDVSRAAQLAAELGADSAGPLESFESDRCDILVNTTSVGLRSDASPLPGLRLASGVVVLDAVYDPSRTRLLRDAEKCGARTVEGKWMLIYQAAEQFSGWTGREAPVDVMAAAFEEAGRAD